MYIFMGEFPHLHDSDNPVNIDPQTPILLARGTNFWTPLGQVALHKGSMVVLYLFKRCSLCIRFRIICPVISSLVPDVWRRGAGPLHLWHVHPIVGGELDHQKCTCIAGDRLIV